jgi:hypothetical protein
MEVVPSEDAALAEGEEVVLHAVAIVGCGLESAAGIFGECGEAAEG